ncbi:TonB-dependent receptor domain-containing protein [Flavobacterium limi]|uniref:TonB-dependent receptor n=1 Tax=Flavobacterium limi TaxID=2045105 RepID=A0ABQ1UYV2_9FLAO|nr:TonB-dependent receptor [Flavobacterium limi]GGF28607.1 TonB-dependent receptor [Flavobacterium limi]
MKQYLLNILLLFFIQTISAQKASIKGTILDDQNAVPIEYASVALLSSLDNSVIEGDVSNKNGNFSIQNIKSGSYKLKIYFVGYESQILENIKVEDNKNTELGAIRLKPGAQELNEVVMRGRKAKSYNKIDKQQYKASQFETAKGGSAVDVIKNLPSVTVNGEGSISFRGSNSFMVLIDGKPVLTDPATILSQLPANTIQNIELITAPSAKYDPDGKGGIINIVTTKGSADSFAISANLTGGLPSTDDYDNLEKPRRFGGDITANYKKNKIDLSLTANYQRNDNNGYREGDAYTKDFDANTITRFPSNGERSFDKYNYSAKTALIYTANKNNSFNFGFYLGRKFQSRRADLVYRNSTSDLISNAVLNQLTYFNSNVQTKEGKFTLANFDYTHTFINKSALTVSALYEHADLYGNTVNLNMDYPAKETVFQEINNPYSNPIYGYRLKLDYTVAIGEGKLESGYQYREDKQDGTFGYTVDPEPVPPVDNSWFRGTARTNNHINAVYSQYSGKSEKLSYIAGLRYEYAQREVVLSTDVNPHRLNFSNLFPSANLLYAFNDSWNAKAGYSKRVQRNNNSELNPIPEREHSETLEQGDPDLLPQFIDLAELGINHTFKKGTLFATLYYQNIKNPVQRVNSVYNDTILNRVYTNAERARLYGVEMGTNLKPWKWVSLYLGANMYNYRINGRLDVLGEASTVDNSDWVYSLNSNCTFSLDKNWSITANVNYTSEKPTAQGEDSRFLVPNMSLKRTILDGKGSLGFQWQNISLGNMGTNQQRITTYGSDFYTTTNYIYETNVLLLNFSYNFNKLTSKNKLPASEFGEKEF